MDILNITILFGTIFVLVGVFFIVYGASFFSAHQVSQRIQKYVVEDREESRPKGFGVREANFSQSILQRIVLPSINTILSYLGRFTPARTINETNRQLMLARRSPCRP